MEVNWWMSIKLEYLLGNSWWFIFVIEIINWNLRKSFEIIDGNNYICLILKVLIFLNSIQESIWYHSITFILLYLGVNKALGLFPIKKTTIFKMTQLQKFQSKPKYLKVACIFAYFRESPKLFKNRMNSM